MICPAPEPVEGRWIALPQPTAFEPAGGLWAPARVRVVADGPGLDREAERIEGELKALGIAGACAAADPVLRLRLSPLPEDPEPRSLSDTSTRRRSLSAGLRETRRGDSRDESFLIEVADDVVVTAAGPVGVFRATRQLLHNLRAQGGVPRGSVQSAPAVAERGLHLDAARKHYPAAWIRQQLHAAADVGINVFQWHFSENEGFRLESEAFGEVVSVAHVTRAEAAGIVALARDLHIGIVPSLDMPGHLRQVLSAHPDLRLPPGLEPADPEHAGILGTDHALDITRDEAVDFALRLIDDMAPVFPHSSRWNLGGDEFVAFERIDDYPALTDAAHERFGPDATGFDLLTAFVNRIAAHLRGRGLEPRVWNDGMLRSAVVELDPDVVLTWWTNWHRGMRPVSAAIAAGHRLVNVNDAMFYYVLGENAGYRHPTAERIWAADWHPGLFPGLWGEAGQGTVRQELARPYPEFLLGCSFAIWSDRPDAQTADEVAEGIRGPLRAMAERAWNAGSALALAEFDEIDRAIGTAAAEPCDEGRPPVVS
ncbi:family 20 glycosylhydrolase [Microbacterium sp. ASV81]|uniref:Family 20 glycosylhydrolase n=1 Tax=Microbacterium capsulatum TaxID=3041921 RepID=A0ABU0XGS1_9MICO|nr:family 20 glycosylhydrolase [Microbacterium sp. ASV81]MDQ4213375.1 family 20 glycosylhydrolase [Microbacterium sp. ASV81]